MDNLNVGEKAKVKILYKSVWGGRVYEKGEEVTVTSSWGHMWTVGRAGNFPAYIPKSATEIIQSRA